MRGCFQEADHDLALDEFGGFRAVEDAHFSTSSSDGEDVETPAAVTKRHAARRVGVNQCVRTVGPANISGVEHGPEALASEPAASTASEQPEDSEQLATPSKTARLEGSVMTSCSEQVWATGLGFLCRAWASFVFSKPVHLTQKLTRGSPGSP